MFHKFEANDQNWNKDRDFFLREKNISQTCQIHHIILITLEFSEDLKKHFREACQVNFYDYQMYYDLTNLVLPITRSD